MAVLGCKLLTHFAKNNTLLHKLSPSSFYYFFEQVKEPTTPPDTPSEETSEEQEEEPMPQPLPMRRRPHSNSSSSSSKGWSDRYSRQHRWVGNLLPQWKPLHLGKGVTTRMPQFNGTVAWYYGCLVYWFPCVLIIRVCPDYKWYVLISRYPYLGVPCVLIIKGMS